MEGTIDVTCKCGHTEIIPTFQDKRGWQCDKCHIVWEVDTSGKMEYHLFHFLPKASFVPLNQRTVHTVTYNFKRLF